MKHYVGNFNNEINCDNILSEIQQHEVDIDHGHMILSKDNPFYAESVNQMNLMQSVGYDETTVEYRHYQSGKHFNSNVSIKFGELVNAVPLMCWVSEVRPGKCVPWHWDINPWENEHKQLGDIVRYFCFLSRPQPGHIFVTATDAYYMEPQGAVYQYEDLHQWHAGSNVGLTPKFLMTFTGYKKV
jgi:hypothetical protein